MRKQMTQDKVVKRAKESLKAYKHSEHGTLRMTELNLAVAVRKLIEIVEAQEWNPIETIPLNTEVLVYSELWEGEINDQCKPDNPVMKVITSNRHGFVICDGDAYAAWAINPTHWKPLPLPPITEET